MQKLPYRKIISFIVCGLMFCNISMAKAVDLLMTDKEAAVYQWFCKAQRDNGLLQAAEGVDICSTYQIALAAMVFTLYGDYDRAEKIFDFYNGKMTEEFSGESVAKRGFVQFHNPKNGIPDYNSYRWLGDNSWLLMAINYYRSKTRNTKYDKMARAIVEWIDDMQDKKGKELYENNDLGIWYGFTGKGDKRLHAKSTEGNVDAYAALYPYADKKGLRRDIKRFIDSMYVSREKRLKIGTTVSSCDSELHAWAYLAFLDDSKYPMDFFEENYKLTVTAEATNKEVTGFAYMPEGHLLGRLTIVCTFEIILPYYLSGDEEKGDYYLKEMEKTMVESKLYPGTKGFPELANKTRWPADPSDVYNVVIHPSAWYLFVKKRFNPFQEFQ